MGLGCDLLSKIRSLEVIDTECDGICCRLYVVICFQKFVA